MGTKGVDRLRILITDAHTRAGLGAVRSLGRAGHVVVVGYPETSEWPPAVWSRYSSTQGRYPAPDRNQGAFQEWLCDQARRRMVDAVLPVAETSVVGTAASRNELTGRVLPMVASDSALRYTLSKSYATRMALDIGIPCPNTVFLSNGGLRANDKAELAKLHFPIIIKTDNHFTASGGYAVGRSFVARDFSQAQSILEDLGELKTPIIAQEFIRGEGVGAFLLRFHGKTHLRFAHRRLHEVPYTGGASSFRKSYHCEELVHLGERLLDSIEYDGVAMVEFRRSAVDGRPYFLEVNGRLWGSLALALHCGIDFPAALVACYQRDGTIQEQRPYRSGVRCRNVYPGEVNHLISVLTATSSQGRDPLPSKRKAIVRFAILSLDPRIRHDYFWWSDPGPGVVQISRMVRWVAGAAVAWSRRELRAYHQRRLVRTLREEHHVRLKQDRYFGRPLRQILFLCYGNICRSAFAVEYWNRHRSRVAGQLPFGVAAGFHPESGRRSPEWLVGIAREYGVELGGHRSRAVVVSDVEAADAVFVMDGENYRCLISLFPWARHRTYLVGLFGDHGWAEISDPYGKGTAYARARCEELVSSLDGLMEQVLRR